MEDGVGEKRNTQHLRRQRLAKQMICLRNCRRIFEVSHVDCAVIKIKALLNKHSLCSVLPISLLTSSSTMYTLTERTWESHTGIKAYQFLHHWKYAKDRRRKRCLVFWIRKELLFPISITMVSQRLWLISYPSSARASILQAVKYLNFNTWTTVAGESVVLFIFMQHHSLRPEQ